MAFRSFDDIIKQITLLDFQSEILINLVNFLNAPYYLPLTL